METLIIIEITGITHVRNDKRLEKSCLSIIVSTPFTEEVKTFSAEYDQL